MNLALIRRVAHSANARLRTSLYNNALFLMGMQLSASFIRFIFWAVAARLFAAEQVGLVTATLSVAMFLSSVATLGLPTGLIYYLPRVKDPVRLINASFSVSMVVALLVAGIFLAGLGWWSPGLSVLQSTVLYALLFLISNVTFALMQIQEVLFVAERSSRLNFYKALFSNLLQVGLLFLCLFLPDWTTIFAVIVLSEVLALVFFNWRYRRTVRRDYRPALVLDPQAWKPIAAYSLSNFVAERISLLPNSVIPLIVLNSLGAASSAYFYMAWSLAGTLGMAGQALGLSLFAESSHNPDEIEKNALHSFAAGMLILVPGVLGILVLGPLALNFLGKAYSQEGTPLLNLLALSVIPMALHRITASVLRARNKIKHLLLANTVTAVLRIGLSLWFIPYLALPGVGIASLASNVLAGVFVAMITFPDALRRGLYSLAGRRVVIFRPVKKDEK